MSQFLIALHRPYGHAPLSDDPAMHRDIDALNAEMVAAGVRVFVGGLRPTDQIQALAPAPSSQTDRQMDGWMRAAEQQPPHWWLSLTAAGREPLALWYCLSVLW